MLTSSTLLYSFCLLARSSVACSLVCIVQLELGLGGGGIHHGSRTSDHAHTLLFAYHSLLVVLYPPQAIWSTNLIVDLTALKTISKFITK